jgi:tetratricopeptide (TPR) repeat protein
VARKQQALGRRHFDVGQGTSNLAFFLTEAGHPSEALPLADESLSIFHGIGLTDGFWVTGASTNRGDALLALGRLSEAAQAFTVALDALSVVPQTELVYALVGLARTRLAQNREADALPLLERALEACEDARPDDIFKADAQFHLARALWLTGGDRSRARALATAAKATYAAHHHSRREAAAQAWLNETLPKGTGPQSRRQ